MDGVILGPIIFEKPKTTIQTATLNDGRTVIYKRMRISSSDKDGYKRSMDAYLRLSGQAGCTGICKLLNYDIIQHADDAHAAAGAVLSQSQEKEHIANNYNQLNSCARSIIHPLIIPSS